jgi:tetratricopeptide (TPR) repeat protein
MAWRGKADPAADGGGPVDLEDLFTRLSEQVDAAQHKKALKLCDDLLKISPGDADAIACKVAALVELTRYDAAVECCTTAPPAVREVLAFEHAYALYRSNSIAGALAVLEGTCGKEKGSFRSQQLRAQLLYRDGRAEESAGIYEELFTVRARVRVYLRVARLSTNEGTRARRRPPPPPTALQIDPQPRRPIPWFFHTFSPLGGARWKIDRKK